MFKQKAPLKQSRFTVAFLSKLNDQIPTMSDTERDRAFGLMRQVVGGKAPLRNKTFSFLPEKSTPTISLPPEKKDEEESPQPRQQTFWWEKL